MGHQFEYPLLSDFSYGEFIYSSQNGKSYRYLAGMSNKTWNFVEEIVVSKKGNDSGETQKILGLIADRKDTSEFFQNKRIICPVCGRNAWHTYRNNVIGFEEVEELTFGRFEKLNPDEKKKEIELLII